MDRRSRLGISTSNGAGNQDDLRRGDHLAVVTHTLAVIKQASHVQGIVHVDSELEFVSEKYASRIGKFHSDLEQLLKGQGFEKLNHEDIIKLLDEAGNTFEILVIKTDLALTYTSVFIHLDAGYWSAEAEGTLR